MGVGGRYFELAMIGHVCVAGIAGMEGQTDRQTDRHTHTQREGEITFQFLIPG